MIENQKRNICVVGGGLAGPMIGIMLAKQGYPVKIMEGRKDMRKMFNQVGRSINLSLSVRGFQALEQVGLKEQLIKISISMIGRMIHDIDGSTYLQRYGIDDTEAIYSVSRSDLNCELLKLAENTPGIEINFDTQCTGYDLESNILYFKNRNISSTKQEEYQIKDHLVVAADGYKSTVRNAMIKGTRMNLSVVQEGHGYKELTLPAGPNGEWLMEKNALHLWPRGDFMFMCCPDLDGSHTCTLFLSYKDGKENFAKLNTDEAILKFFNHYFADVACLMPDLVEQFKRNPIGEFCTVKSSPWNYKDQTILIGDAAHGLVPFYGQGMNCALEDCVIFTRMLETHNELTLNQDDWTKILEEFATKRKPDTDAIQDLAVENFLEMRFKVNDPFFQLKKKCELMIASEYPDFHTKYFLVCFSTTPYCEAMKKGQIHDQVLSEVCSKIKDSSEFDVERAYQLIQQKYRGMII